MVAIIGLFKYYWVLLPHRFALSYKVSKTSCRLLFNLFSQEILTYHDFYFDLGIL
jgi:hypothetical protein